VCFHILDLGFDNTGEAYLGSDLDPAGSHFAVVSVPVKFTALLYHAVAAGTWRVVAEHVQRLLAGMETSLAGFNLLGFILFADLILKTTAFQLPVEALKSC
jgi:hypothetical protein